MIFDYDAMGNRTRKAVTAEVVSLPTSPLDDGINMKRLSTTYYVYDAQGNVMAIYERKFYETQEQPGSPIVPNNDLTLKELPIYGSTRIGMFKPELLLYAYTSAYLKENEYPQPNTNSEPGTLYLTTTTGVKKVNLQVNNVAPVVTSTNLTANSYNPAYYLTSGSVASLGAYFDNATSLWKIRKNSYNTAITSTVVTSGSISATANPVIVPKPGSANTYYFIYPHSNASAATTIKYVDVNTSTNAVSAVTTLTPTTCGQKLLAVNYGSGTSRVFFYYTTDGTATTVPKITITSADINYGTGTGAIVYNTPNTNAVVNMRGTNGAGFIFNYDLDMAISPNGKKIAIVINRASSTGLGAARIAVFDLDPQNGLLSNKKEYDNGTFSVKNLEFSKSGRYLIYSYYNGLLSQNALGRIDLEADYVDATTGVNTSFVPGTTFNATGNLDLMRTINNKIIISQQGQNTLKQLINSDDPAATAGQMDANITLASGTFNLGLPNNNNLFLADNMINYATNGRGKEIVAKANVYTRAIGAKSYELKDHLGNIRAVVSDVKLWVSADAIYDGIAENETDVLAFTDYYSFGSTMPGRNYINGSSYRYGMNGKEKDDEIVGSGNSIDFGERMYDPRLGRMRSIDRYANKYPYMSPYSYAANNPIAAIDIAGDSLYILFHVTGNGHGDDMFKAAALTRQYDIEHSGHFDPKRDKVVVLAVQNMSDIKTKTEQTVADNKATYGNTVEFGLWSHSGLDGPIGTTPTTKNPLYSGSTQMNKEGWGDINFNWQGNGGDRAGIYGCNSGNPVGDGVSFTNGLSGLDNFKDVTVSGQTTSAYPSTSPTSRDLSFAQLVNDYLPIVYFPMAKEATKEVVRKTYMVGGNKGSSSDAFFGGTKANPMEKSKNGTVIK